MNKTEVTNMVSGFAKANPETIERLNAAAREMLNPCRQELTAQHKNNENKRANRRSISAHNVRTLEL